MARDIPLETSGAFVLASSNCFAISACVLPHKLWASTALGISRSGVVVPLPCELMSLLLARLQALFRSLMRRLSAGVDRETLLDVAVLLIKVILRIAPVLKISLLVAILKCHKFLMICFSWFHMSHSSTVG